MLKRDTCLFCYHMDMSCKGLAVRTPMCFDLLSDNLIVPWSFEFIGNRVWKKEQGYENAFVMQSSVGILEPSSDELAWDLQAQLALQLR